MKELDFDELDRAVSSLMSKNGSTLDQPSNQPKDETNTSSDTSSNATDDTILPSSTVDVPPRREVASSDSRSSVVASARPEVRPTISSPASSTPSLATKRSGRFMDVVHPSSDMTKTSLASTRPADKITLTPISATVTPEPVTQARTPEAPASVAAPVIEKTSMQDQDTSWPDPLEFHEQPQAFADTVSPKDDQVSAPESGSLVESTTAQENVAETSQSPFLADAKVEKRPLGGGTIAEEAIVPKHDEQPIVSQDLLNQPTAETADTQTTPKIELPAELHSDLLAVESDEAAKLPSASSASVISEPAPTGPVSIAQQYKKQETSRDTSHTAMYDNAAQPLAHPAKKKSGWLGVVLILVVIILLIGAAAAAYFMGFIPL